MHKYDIFNKYLENRKSLDKQKNIICTVFIFFIISFLYKKYDNVMFIFSFIILLLLLYRIKVKIRLWLNSFGSL